MSQLINKRKLWVLFTTMWCVTIFVIFLPSLRQDYRSSSNAMDDAASSQLQERWDECANKYSPDPYLKFSAACRAQVESNCKNSGIWGDRCQNFEEKSCVESKVTQCTYIFMDSQREFSEKPRWKYLAERSLHFLDYSISFWLFLGLLFCGPLSFWISPKILRALHHWLYS